jgi:hypothetical protein
VEAFEVVRMEDISGGAYDTRLEIEVALVRCKQVAAAVGRDGLAPTKPDTNSPLN